MKIGPTYVTFEQSCLLKKKGFDVECTHYYEEVTHTDTHVFEDQGELQDWNKKVYCGSKPEQWQVVEWLRVTHGIFIYANEEFRPYIIKNGKNLIYNGELSRLVECNNGFITKYTWNTPQEAYSAAFDYVLTNLI